MDMSFAGNNIQTITKAVLGWFAPVVNTQATMKVGQTKYRVATNIVATTRAEPDRFAQVVNTPAITRVVLAK